MRTSASPKPGQASQPPLPLGEALSRLAAAAPGAPAVTCGERTLSRSQLEATANRLARVYQHLGVDAGAYVTISLKNGIEFVSALYATWKLGAVPQPVSWRMPVPELCRIIGLTAPALVLGDPGGRDSIAHLPAGFAPGTKIPDSPLPSRVSPSWKASTSGGSTGTPKLIVSATSGTLPAEAIAARYQLRQDQVQLVPGPLYHNAPLLFATVGTAIGQHVVVMERFDAGEALELIGRHKVSAVNLVPTMMQRMIRAYDADPARYDLTSIEVVWHMGAPCPAWVKERWIDLVGADRLFELYGSTESVAATAITGSEWLEHRASVGRPVYGEISITGPDGFPLPAGSVGEVATRATPGSPGYRYIGASATQLPGGWEATGDLGWMDKDGYLYLTDRRADLIVTGGANVFPAEVEAAILEHPSVSSCVVVGLPDDDLGERVHAVVEPCAAVQETDLKEFVASRLVRYKVPRSFRFVPEPLRDDAGKVRRSAVRQAETKLIGRDQR